MKITKVTMFRGLLFCFLSHLLVAFVSLPPLTGRNKNVVFTHHIVCPVSPWLDDNNNFLYNQDWLFFDNFIFDKMQMAYLMILRINIKSF